MMSTDFKRILRSGVLSFQRNSWLTTASILVMTLVLTLVGGLLFLHTVTSTVLANLSDKIDISVYIKPGTPENEILKMKKDLLALSEVKDINYISQDDALTEFKATHQGNALILDSLDELDTNPLQSSLNIKAKETGQFEKISTYLSEKNYSFVDKINFFENRAIIDRLAAITEGVRSGGILLAMFLAVIAMIIAFNTIRIAIYSNREEVQIMKLVGASHWYIRGPFIVEGVLQGVVSSLITLAVLFPIAAFLSPRLGNLISGFDLLQYFKDNVFFLFAILLSVGVILGITSSMIAIRRYLKEV